MPDTSTWLITRPVFLLISRISPALVTPNKFPELPKFANETPVTRPFSGVPDPPVKTRMPVGADTAAVPVLPSTRTAVTKLRASALLLIALTIAAAVGPLVNGGPPVPPMFSVIVLPATLTVALLLLGRPSGFRRRVMLFPATPGIFDSNRMVDEATGSAALEIVIEVVAEVTPAGWMSPRTPAD